MARTTTLPSSNVRRGEGLDSCSYSVLLILLVINAEGNNPIVGARC